MTRITVSPSRTSANGSGTTRKPTYTTKQLIKAPEKTITPTKPSGSLTLSNSTIRGLKEASLKSGNHVSPSGTPHNGAGVRRENTISGKAGSPVGTKIIPVISGESNNSLSNGGGNTYNSAGTYDSGGNSYGLEGNYSYTESGTADIADMLQSMYEQQLSQQQEAQKRLSEQLKAQQEAYEAQLRAQQEAQKQAAQNAYNNNLSALESAYTKRISGLDSNYDSTKNLLASSYGNSRTNLQSNEENALREAYINRMMNEKNLRQQLNAQGLNGGASESAIASMLNNYGTSRNNIQNTAADNLRELEQTYNGNIANAQQKYNDAVNSANDSNMAYRMQLENDLANNTVSSHQDLYNALANMDSNYTNAMSNLINNQSSANADLQNTAFKAMLENALAPTTLSVSRSSKASSSSNSSNTLVKRVKNMRDNGYVAADIASSLAQEGYTIPQIEQMFAEAGIEY